MMMMMTMIVFLRVDLHPCAQSHTTTRHGASFSCSAYTLPEPPSLLWSGCRRTDSTRETNPSPVIC